MEEKVNSNTNREYQPLSQIVSSEGWRLGLLFIVIFTSYLVSMPKTVMLEDDGLFIMSSYFLGIAHPPGYPIHTLIGHLFTHIPIGSVASRAHAMSGFFGALGCVLIALIVMQLLRARIAAYPAAMMLAWSPVYWSQSIIAEVYTLNAFFFLLILLLLLDAVDYHTKHATDSSECGKSLSFKIAPIAFLYGLSLTNHWPLMILSSSCYLIIAWPILKDIAQRLPLIFICFALGLTPYLWMYLYTPPPPGYAVMGPINTFEDLWFYISRKGYSGVDNSITAGIEDKLAFIGFFSKETVIQLFPLGTLLAATGFVVQWKILGRRISLALTVGFISTSLLLIGLLNFDFDLIRQAVIQVYFIPAYAILTIICATGILYADMLWVKTTLKNHNLQHTARLAIPVFAILLIITLNLKENFRHFDNWTKEYADIILSTIENDSVVFTDSDTTAGPLGYFHLVENRRPDLELRNIYGLIYPNRLYNPKHPSDNDRAILIEYINTEQKKIFFTTRPDADFGYSFNGLHYLAQTNRPGNKNLFFANNMAIINYLVNLSRSPDSLDEWTNLRKQEIVTNAIPVFISLYITNPRQNGTALSFIKNASTSFQGKIMLIGSLLGYKDTFPKELGDIETLLISARDQLRTTNNKKLSANYYLLAGIHQLNNNNLKKAINLFRRSISEWPRPENMAYELLETANTQATSSNI